MPGRAAQLALLSAACVAAYAPRSRTLPRSPVRAPRAALSMEVDEHHDAIRWLPPINPSRPDREQSRPDSMVLPLFPLGNVARGPGVSTFPKTRARPRETARRRYTPGSTQVLNIFEPRYRKMYSDILMSGSRRFVTTMVNPDGEGELAEVGVVLYLEDLKEVSQQTNDAVKYVCSHKVLDTRVAIHAILNPGDSATRETYMKCEVSELTDDDEPAEDAEQAPAAGEADVMAALFEVAAMQEDGKEDVRFSRDAVQKLDAGRGVGSGSLWGVVELWKSFLDARAQAAGRKVQQDVQNRLIKYLTDKSGGEAKAGELPQSVNLSELPPDLQRDVKNLRERVMDDVAPLVDEQTRGIQTLLQAESHADRLDLFLDMVNKEKSRLTARKTLKATLASLEDKFK